MNTSVLSIQSVEETDNWVVMMSIGSEQKQFTFTVEKPKQEKFAVVGGDITFCKFFRFNQHIAANVTDLVGKVYLGKTVDLPAEVGKLFTPEDAIAYGTLRDRTPKTLDKAT